MARLYADEDFPYPVVVELRRLGHDVMTVQELGRTGREDADQFSYAVADGRAMLIKNRGSGEQFRLMRANPGHAGMILISQDNDFAGQAGRIHAEISAAGGVLAGLEFRIYRPQRTPTP